jgi:HNH endonuclease
LNPTRWGVTLTRDFVRLNVGMIEVTSIRKRGGIEVSYAIDLLPPDAFSSEGVARGSDDWQVSVPGVDGAFIEPDHFLEVLPLFHQAHFDAIRRAAASRRHSTMTKAHSPGVISFLNDHLNVGIPQPEYFIPPFVGELEEPYSEGASKLLAEQEQQLIAAGVFDPDNVLDARERILAAIVQHRGQPVFRRQLLRAYAGQCAISGCNVEAALDAAHIVSYKGPETNHPANGLLLRTDLHTLFDLGLVAVDTETMRVLIAPSLAGTCYQQYGDKRLCLPSDRVSHPSREALDQHRAASSIPKRSQ